MSVFVNTHCAHTGHHGHFISFVSVASVVNLTLNILTVVIILSIVGNFRHRVDSQVLNVIPRTAVINIGPVSS